LQVDETYESSIYFKYLKTVQHSGSVNH